MPPQTSICLRGLRTLCLYPRHFTPPRLSACHVSFGVFLGLNRAAFVQRFQDPGIHGVGHKLRFQFHGMQRATQLQHRRDDPAKHRQQASPNKTAAKNAATGANRLSISVKLHTIRSATAVRKNISASRISRALRLTSSVCFRSSSSSLACSNLPGRHGFSCSFNILHWNPRSRDTTAASRP